MKYNDNGEYKDIYVKTFDTLPVGAIVEYSGSTIPSGWTDIGNNQIQKTSQYIEGGASLSNVYGTSDENGYTQEFINNNVGVVESGSNTNGSYIKYADGTMICWQKQTFVNYQITGQQGNLYTTSLTPLDYPVAFVGSLPSVSRSIESTTWTVYGFGSNNATAPSLTNSGSFEIFRGSSTGTGVVNTTINTIAIGRWK